MLRVRNKTRSLVLRDFLAPSFIHGRSGSSSSQKLQSPHSAFPLQTTNSSLLLDKIKRQISDLKTSDGKPLSDNQVELFNRTSAGLRQALKNRDVRLVWEHWSLLDRQKLLRFLGPSQLGSFSNLIATFCPDFGLQNPWDESERRAIEDIALAAAGRGYMEALNAAMAVHIRMNDPEAILKLYRRYLEVVKQRNIWEEEASAKGGHDGDTTYDALASTNLPPENVPHSSAEVAVLLATATAYAMQDSFENALRASLGTGIRFQHYPVRAFLRNLEHNPQLREKVESYVRRLEIARMLARASLLSLHISNLGRDQAIKALESLYVGIMDGLSGPNPYIAPHPAAIDSSRQVLMPELIWKSLLASFLRCSRKDLAERLWDDMLRLGIRPGVSVWTTLFDGYDSMGAVDEMLNGWDVMISQGVQPDGLTYRALISTLFHGNRPLEAMERFKMFEMEFSQRPSMEPSHVLSIYNTVLHGLLITKQENEATALLESMRSKGPKPDVVSYNTFLRYYGRRGDFKAQALMIQNLTSDGLVGDVFTFSTIMSSLLKIGREDAPEMMINLMLKQGIKPNTATYSAIIDQQLREQDTKNFQAALAILQKMEQDPNAHPNEVTYTTILAGIYRGRWLEPAVAEDCRQDILKRMKKRNIQLNQAGYHIMVKACLEYPEPKGLENALGYYREMVQRKIQMGRDTWYILLRGLIDRGEWMIANEMADNMMRSRIQPPAGIMELVSKIRRGTAEKIKSGPEAYF